MDALLVALAKAIPDLLQTHGVTFFVMVLSIGGNVVQWRIARQDAKDAAAALLESQKEVEEEIRKGASANERWRETFEIATQAFIAKISGGKRS